MYYERRPFRSLVYLNISWIYWLPVPCGLALRCRETSFTVSGKASERSDRFLPLVLFFPSSSLLSHCTLMDHRNQNSHHLSLSLSLLSFLFALLCLIFTTSILLFIIFFFHPPHYCLLSRPPLFCPPSIPLVRLWLCTHALFHGNYSPPARALLWNRPPSSCFHSPPAEWVSDWARETREEREEEVTLSFKPSSLFAWWHAPV